MSNRKRKICILLPTHWASKMGGAQYQARILVDYLIANGKFEIFYLARRVKEDFQPSGYEIVKIPGPAIVRPRRFFETTFSLLKILREIRPDVIYQQVGCAYTGIAAYYARRHDCRMVWRVSSDSNVIPPALELSRDIIYEIIDRKIMDYGIRHADAILVQTPHQGRLLKQNYGREADAVIRNFHPLPQEAVEKAAPVKILWIANFKKLKQPEVFIRLARDMIGRADAQFVMVGAPAAGTKWFARLEEEIKTIDNLTYTGALPQDEVNRLIATSHILVNTSEYEGFSNTFIQAWMRKVPVVTLNVNPDGIFNEHKIGFCADGDYSRLLHHVKILASEPNLLQEMADYAQRYANENHSLKNIERIVEFLSE